jgi:hypothetical protein
MLPHVQSVEGAHGKPHRSKIAQQDRACGFGTLAGNSSPMSLRREEHSCSLGRRSLGALLAFALVAAGLLSVSPALHEFFHPDISANHLCAVTLFASGHCEAAAAAPVSAAPNAPLLAKTLSLPEAPILSQAHFFSLLEHAPPARA